MKIYVKNEQKRRLRIRKIKDLVAFVFKKERALSKTNEISILLTNNSKIKRLNEKYLSKKRPTDVLSFSMREGAFGYLHNEIVGDVVVSVEQANIVSKESKTSFEKEVWLYVVHGVLHLLGYNDNTKKNAAKMEERCQTILKKWSERV